jgi:hypothetical protein
MTYYIAQQDPHGRTKVWEAEDEAEVIRLVQTEYEHEFDDVDDAVAYDKQRALIEPCPAHLLARGYNLWPGLTDAVLSTWGVECDDEVDLSNDDEWGTDTDGGARISGFQDDDVTDLDGAEIGRVGDYDVIWLPDANRGAMVSNGDAQWFDARSFRHASLFALGAWDGETGRG